MALLLLLTTFFNRVLCILLQLDMEYSSQFHDRNQRNKNFRKGTSKKRGGKKKKKKNFV